MTSSTRRNALRMLSAAPLAGALAGLPRIGRAADFSLKYGNNLPLTHPLNIRSQEAADRDHEGDQGPRRDQDLPEQPARRRHRHARAGASAAASTCSRRRRWSSRRWCRSAAINAVGFAFKDYDQVWGAMDGKLGALRARRDREGAALRVREDVGQRLPPDHDQQRSRSPAAKDMDGLKIRVPVSPLSISCSRRLGAVAGQPAVQRGLFVAADARSSTRRRIRCRSSRSRSSTRCRSTAR